MHVSVRLVILVFLTQDRFMVCAERTKGSKSLWTHLIEHPGDLGHVVSHFGPFGESLSIGAR
jgi:hypothetical protein